MSRKGKNCTLILILTFCYQSIRIVNIKLMFAFFTVQKYGIANNKIKKYTNPFPI